jgi:hypothetical protein
MEDTPLNNSATLERLPTEDLIRLIEMNAKNWLALDGVWFQSVEQKCGMQEAMYHDEMAWRRYTVLEAKRIKEFLRLPENPGLDGLAKALELRPYASINDYELVRTEDSLILRNVDCRVQTARSRKGMPYHPCKPVGLVEYAGFARAIDARISCSCLSCYPEVTDETTACAWEFTLSE